MSVLVYKALELSAKKYDAKTFHHAVRVANYARENKTTKHFLTDEDRDVLYCISLLHDIIEDTDVNFDDLDKLFGTKIAVCVSELTKDDDTDYIDYIKNLSNKSIFSYLVKIADMKDHLSLTETLTDKLRDKYLTALPYLL